MLENYWEGLKAFAWNSVWAVNLATLSPAHAGTIKALRVAHMMIRELADGQLNLRAASLVYMTLLSLVPVLALSFALFKGFGVHHSLTPALMNVLEPLGEQGVEFGNKLIAMVESVDVGRLGVVGLAVLLFTVIRVMQKVEQSLNYTWRVKSTRRFFERLGGYLSVTIFGPVFIIAAMFITGSLMNSAVVTHLIEVAHIGALVTLGGKLVPYLLVVAAFTFVYMYMPDARVRIGSALFGALVAGFLWAFGGWAFAAMVVGSTRFTVIYSSFAIVILSIMWIYVSWLILLMGGSVAFYHQNPEYFGLLTHELRFSNRVKERLSLLAVFFVFQNFHYRLDPWTTAALARRLRVPLAPLELMLEALERASIVVAVSGASGAYVPARDPESLTVRDVLDAVRAEGESHGFTGDNIVSEPVVDGIYADIHQAVDEALGGRSLRDLVVANPPAGNDGAVPASAATDLFTVVAAKESYESGDHRADDAPDHAAKEAGENRS